jgi:hypothetical protein
MGGKIDLVGFTVQLLVLTNVVNYYVLLTAHLARFFCGKVGGTDWLLREYRRIRFVVGRG